MSSPVPNRSYSKISRRIFAIPAPRPQSVQQAALANFDTVWNYLKQQCSQVAGSQGVQ